jgi:glyoxylase-like metal-dependent hydrolase (beta-lactamase superfamily II)
MKALTSLLTFLAGLLGSLPLAGQTDLPALEISHLTGDFYVFTTYGSYKGQRISSNGLYLVTDAGAVMIDTPWDTTQFAPLLDSIRVRHGKEVMLCLATHSHADRTAGFDFLRQRGVKTFSSEQTYQLCRVGGHKLAEFRFRQDTTFTVGGRSFTAYYPGEGHTRDNIVVWFPEARILYGGCLVKSTEATDLGNVAEANLAAWPATMRNLSRKFPRPRYVIPGHQSWASTESLGHTLELLRRPGEAAGGR